MEIDVVMLDTNAYAAFKRGSKDVVELLVASRSIIVNAIVLGELVGGFAAGSRQAANVSELREFPSLAQVKVVPITAMTADVYGELYASLRAAGTPVPTNDMWIAASAVELDVPLVTDDRHFQMIPRVRAVRSLRGL